MFCGICLCCQRKCLGWLGLLIIMTHNGMCIFSSTSSVFGVNFCTAQNEYLKKLQQYVSQICSVIHCVFSFGRLALELTTSQRQSLS